MVPKHRQAPHNQTADHKEILTCLLGTGVHTDQQEDDKGNHENDGHASSGNADDGTQW